MTGNCQVRFGEQQEETGLLEEPRLLLTLRKPHVRFNEGPVETQFGWALPVYSTNKNTMGV